MRGERDERPFLLNGLGTEGQNDFHIDVPPSVPVGGIPPAFFGHCSKCQGRQMDL